MTPAIAPCVGHRRLSLPGGAYSPRPGCGDSLHSKLICRVLAPPEAPGRRPRSAASVDVSQTPATPAAPPSGDFWSSTTSFASQLMSHFRVPTFAAPPPDAVLRAASSKERELQTSKAPLDLTAFLSPVGVWELKHIRRLSSLTSLTYYMHLVTPGRLYRMHGLELVTTSRACDIRPYEHNKTAEEVGADGDGMAVSVHEAREVYQALKRDGGAASAAAPPLPGSSNIVTLPREVPYQVVLSPAAAESAAAAPPAGGQPMRTQQPGIAAAAATPSAGAALPRMLRSPAEVVGAKIAEAAQAAQAAAASSPLASAAESIYAQLAMLPIGLVGANNRASNALVMPPAAAPTPAAAAADAGAAAPADGGGSADAGGAAYGNGRKATAASIAAMATDKIRQQTTRGALFGGSGRGGSSGGGMAAVSASGMAPANAAAAVAPAPASSSSSSSLVFSSSSSFACPSEWFVVDDPATQTRVFVIQGSDTLDHWKLNLTFDPVPFEDPALGVKVHRGVYEAAMVLYDRFLPLVYEHLESSPFSKIAFTGHSIGGSLATLLMIMYRSRGVLPPHSIATVYTFGAPAVFCQTHSTQQQQQQAHGAAGAAVGAVPGAPSVVPCPPSGSNSWVSPSLWSLGSISGSSSSVEDAAFAGGPPPSPSPSPALCSASSASLQSFDGMAGLPATITRPGPASATSPSSSSGCSCGGADLMLSRLHLPPHVVRNVIMTRDIVPRAFACDYSPVADILKGWGSSFKEHCCLNRTGRKHLYYFVGRMVILQPDPWHSFAANDPDHPMLPPGPELFALTDAPPPQAAAAPPQAPAAAGPAPAARVVVGPPRSAPGSLTEAIWELMDCPHPLETLADPGAYLASGSISRYHNPDNYTRALGRITHLKRMAERRAGGGGGGGAAARPARPPPPLQAEAEAVPWDSSDGQDLDLRLAWTAAAAAAAADVHL